MKSLLVALAAVLAATTVAQTSPNRAFLNNRYAELSNLMRKRDTAGLRTWFMKWTTPEFEYFTSQRVAIGRDQLLASMQQQVSMMRSVDSVTAKITRLNEKPNEISATISTTIRAMVALDPKANPVRFASDSVSIDRWVRVNGNWRLARVTTTRDNSTLDGKPLSGQGQQ